MKWLTGLFAAGTFAALYILEKKRPLRKSIESPETNALRNLAIASTAGLAINLLEKPVTNNLTRFVDAKNVGILKIFRLPKFVETALAVILLDYTLYLWHVMTHKNPFLWRFHKVHHADLDLTASTAFRFHFGELSISIVFRAGQILLIGVSPTALSIWQSLLLLSVLFHHSNVRLEKKLEEKLEKLILTPRLHGIHHSVKQDEMDSNWSSGLIVWDKIHGTFRNDVPQNVITIGVLEFKEIEDVSLPKMLKAPFAV